MEQQSCRLLDSCQEREGCPDAVPSLSTPCGLQRATAHGFTLLWSPPSLWPPWGSGSGRCTVRPHLSSTRSVITCRRPVSLQPTSSLQAAALSVVLLLSPPAKPVIAADVLQTCRPAVVTALRPDECRGREASVMAQLAPCMEGAGPECCAAVRVQYANAFRVFLPRHPATSLVSHLLPPPPCPSSLTHCPCSRSPALTPMPHAQAITLVRSPTAACLCLIPPTIFAKILDLGKSVKVDILTM